MPVFLKDFIDSLFDPVVYTIMVWTIVAVMILAYRIWTKPKIAISILVLAVLFFILSFPDANFNKVVTKPDNIPIVSLIFIIGFFCWLSLRQASINDERMEKGEPPMEALESNERVLVWPDLVYTELIAMIVCTAVLVVWSVYIKAPLEEPANPGSTPNPSKAPWYFLGLQEMLVYFDPWIAGVVLPSLIISGLMVVPYCDKNPRGVGYYTLKERPFAISVFLFGFLVLWISLIVMGTFLRGPNWNFFGPYEVWDVHKIEALNNINLSEYFWIDFMGQALPESWAVRELPGLLLVAGYLFVLPPLLAFTVFKKMYKQMGFLRYNLMIMHLIIMAAMVIKMVLRWTINLKYIVFIPEYFFNI